MKSDNKTAIILALILLTAGCVPAQKNEIPGGYDLNNPEKFFMPESLLEISGITFNKGKNDTVYAIQDEEGKLFRLAWKEKKQYHTKFGKKGDYEDVTIIKDKVIVLKSNGFLYSFPLSESLYEETDSVREWKHLLPEGEYEGIYGEEASGKLYVICKNCLEDNSKSSVSGYILQSGDSIYQVGNFQVNVNGIKAIAGKVKRGFRPSALTKNPRTGEWFILSAVNKLLVITDSSWKVKDAFVLNSNIFNQPEGIAFDNEENLYISNEGDDLSEGNILKFIRH